VPAPADDELRIVRRAAVLALLLTAGCPASTPPPKASPNNEPVRAEVLFERHLRAVGGSRAIEKLMGATLAFAIAYPDRGVEGTGRLTLSDGPAKLELDLAGIGKIEKTYDDAWASDLHFDVHLAQHYAAAKTIGDAQVDGIAVWEVEAKGPTGPVTLSFDKSAGVLLALRGEVETPEGKQTTSSRFADYQDFGGIRCARRITQRTGERVQVIELRSIDQR
jgi:hypothetical protein